MATLLLKSSHKKQHAVICFRGQKDLPHPTYSPDLAPSDSRLFGPMKKHRQTVFYVSMCAKNHMSYKMYISDFSYFDD